MFFHAWRAGSFFFILAALCILLWPLRHDIRSFDPRYIHGFKAFFFCIIVSFFTIFFFAFVGIMMCITDVSDEHMLSMLAGKLAYLFAFQANFRFIFIVLGLYSCAAWLDFIFGRFFRAKHMPLE